MPFTHPVEVKAVNGWGPKLVEKLTDAYESYCRKNGLPMPENTSWKKTKKGKAASALDTADGDESASPKKKKPIRKPKEYIPAKDSGPYAILLALYRAGSRSGRGNVYMAREEVIEIAQPYCASSFTESDRGSYYTAWNSMKNLCEKEYVHQKGRPYKFALTEAGAELAQKLDLLARAEEEGMPLLGSQSSGTGLSKEKGANPSKTAAPKAARARPTKAAPKKHPYSSDDEPVDEDDRIMQRARRLARESESPMPARKSTERTSARSSAGSKTKPAPKFTTTAYGELVDEDDRIMQSGKRLGRESEPPQEPLSGSIFRGQTTSTLFSTSELQQPSNPTARRFPGLGGAPATQRTNNSTKRPIIKSSEPILLDSSDDEPMAPIPPLKNPSKDNFGVPRKETVPLPRMQPDGTLRKPSPVLPAPPKRAVSAAHPVLERATPMPTSDPTFAAFTPLMFPPHSFTIHLVLDNREKSSRNAPDHIQNTMQRLYNLESITRPLSLGDVQWIARQKETGQEVVLDVIVERKRLDDLVSSIKDGRLHEQKFRLKRSGISRVIYIIENYSSKTGNERVFGNGVVHGIPADALETTIAGMQVNDNVFVKRTERIEDTVRYLATITRSLEEKIYPPDQPLYYLPTHLLDSKTFPQLCAHLTKTQPDRKYHVDFVSFNSMMGKGATSTLADVFIKMLMVVKGVSAEKAVHIQNVYKVPARLLQAYDDLGDDWEGKKLMLFKTCGGVVGRKAVGKALSAKIAEVWAGSGDDIEEEDEDF